MPRAMNRQIFDAHLDLAWNAVAFDRDLTWDVAEVRRREQGMTDEPSRGRNTLTLPELRKAGVRVCVATLLARSGPEPKVRQTIKRTDLDHSSPSIAHAVAQGQLAYYRLLEAQGVIRILRTASDLDAHWNRSPKEAAPLGVILSMEGTDP